VLNSTSLLPEQGHLLTDATPHSQLEADVLPPVLLSGPTGGGTGGGAAGSGTPLAVPAYSSLPGAKATLYLDFNGHSEASWGSYGSVSAPAYDTDNDPTSFSSTELASIQKIWQQVAEDYAPFNINVTTVEPSSFANGVAQRVVIGGNGSWTGGTYGGISYVGSFTNSAVNTSWVFPDNLGSGYAKYVADAAAHEAGHAFGLVHQSAYSGSTQTAAYQSGPGDGTAPLMGNSYSASRSLWWYGQSDVSSTTYQNDMDVIASSTNGFGYRTDDFGGTASTAASLDTSSGSFSQSGVIEKMTDTDAFSFTTGAGNVSLKVDVQDGINNLDPVLELRDAQWNLVSSAHDTSGFDATITANLSAGTYFVVVKSSGASSGSTSTNYGFNVGQYTVSGTVVASSVQAPSAPSNLSGSASSSSSVSLSWTDNSSNETGFLIERLNGSTWSQVASVSANVTSYQDSGLAAGTSYSYRVRATNAAGNSAYSNTATATTQQAQTNGPTAPSNLSGTVIRNRSGLRVSLTWKDNSSNETGFRVYRSTDGTNWTLLTQTRSNRISYTDSSVSSSTATYYYKVVAYNSSGTSSSNVLTVNLSSAAPAAMEQAFLADGQSIGGTALAGQGVGQGQFLGLSVFTASAGETRSAVQTPEKAAHDTRPQATQGGEWMNAVARLMEQARDEPILKAPVRARNALDELSFGDSLYG
jgi:hypothetical protein